MNAQDAPQQVGTLVLGYFDPLTAAHVARLAELGASLTVAVLDPPDPLLPARARAELVAALRAVAQVMIGPPPASVRAERTFDETQEHLRARAALVERIVTA
jgi:hypothetical protein